MPSDIETNLYSILHQCVPAAASAATIDINLYFFLSLLFSYGGCVDTVGFGELLLPYTFLLGGGGIHTSPKTRKVPLSTKLSVMYQKIYKIYSSHTNAWQQKVAGGGKGYLVSIYERL